MINWYSKSEGVFEHKGQLRKLRDINTQDEVQRFNKATFGNLDKTERSKVLHLHKLRTEDELLVLTRSIIKHLSDIRVQRSVCKALYLKYKDIEQAIYDISEIEVMDKALFDDYVTKLEKTYDYYNQAL